LCAAAEQSKKGDLMQRMKSAYVFHIKLGSMTLGRLLHSEAPDLDISYRMAYQLSNESPHKSWSTFARWLDSSYSDLSLSIGKVITMLANLEKIDNVKNMTVILCVDGLLGLADDGTKNCDFYRLLTAVCGFLNSSTAFVVCVCSAAAQMPVYRALAHFPQKCVLLLPPALRGDEIMSTRTMIEKQLMDDMGGHGRALEALEGVLLKHKDSMEEIDPTYLFDKVCEEIERKSGIFDSPLFNAKVCQEVLIAILSRRTYGIFDQIGQTNLTVDEICRFGFVRWTPDKRLNCPFILLVMMVRSIGELKKFNEHFTRSVLAWQRVEQFVALYRQVKSIVYRKIPVDLSTFHSGACFGSINGIVIRESNSRTVEAAHHHDTKSGYEDSTCFTIRVGSVTVSDTYTNVINGSSTSAGDIFMRIRLTMGDQEVECNEVIQCKLLKSKQNINAEMYENERAKAVNKNSDVFLLITSAHADEFALPARCGIVSSNEFDEYFGPFAGRAYQSFMEPPNINTASYHELWRIEGVGDALAKEIVNERNKRRFSNYEDAVKQLSLNKKRKTSDILRAMQYDHE